MTDALTRCRWAQRPLEIEYHDTEWGVPVTDDPTLFELLTLEGAQAGLSWHTVLAKRCEYQSFFEGFDPTVIAAWGPDQIEAGLANPGLIRHRQKLASVILNAQGILKIQAEFGSFAEYLWSFVDGQPLQPGRRTMADIPAKTEHAERLSRDLKRRGFKFVGPTICYALMQAVGLINDHTQDCFRYTTLQQAQPNRLLHAIKVSH